ncbi:hypothetical protein EV200_103607 [Pedobacter psychrotolerans]|uniref:GLPGLI family protein n=1 Tax=Pedobacter psychrotolerans TaxID=1843235 RepID=A0A4R2HJP3_9SPHI|nr:hypothetical protein [Pedobacter psychrotolerans]TCO27273.1 hypothetical protein EV200_103607 [Pedobacter psychrotolerans]GGE60327.1 hypothetical protein GCM10011413_28440 [Pedobacter psychrotolerans]
MKKFILCFLFALAAYYSFAQNVTVGPSAKPLLKSVVKTSVQGSPYFNERYTSGKIKTASQKEFTINNLKYNLETQQLEYAENDQIYAIQDSVQSFTLVDSLGKENVFFKLNSENATGFYKIIADGKIALLKKYTVRKEENQDWYTKKTGTKNVQHQVYFTNQDGIIKNFIPSIKSINAVLADNKNQVMKFIKNEQLNPKQEDDLIRIFNFYNTLKQ